FTSGAVISLFDVSDLSDPQRIAKLNFDDFLDFDARVDGASRTPVSWDAKAFTYWDGNAIVPVSWWSYDMREESNENGSAAVVVDVDLNNGNLTEVGRVSHPATTWCEDGVYYEDPPLSVPTEETDTESTDAEASFVDPPEEEELTRAPDPGPDDRFCERWTPEIQRSVIINDNLYTLSEGGVLVSDFDSLDAVSWIPFERR
ncbi:MAG: hypothetical protein GY925_07610, partial [Actinomycetia bacterium]|nr:hypothetical protein [Actinomycetes bacterium]